jgi:hypothetical protein
MADPYFDLANFSVNNELGPGRDEAVLQHYFGSVDDSKLATLALMKLVSEMREAMWGAVQGAVSELEVDYDSYATERFERFEVLLAAMELGRLLVQAAASTVKPAPKTYERTRELPGSNNGSAATSAPTKRPKMPTSTRRPGSSSLAGR